MCIRDSNLAETLNVLAEKTGKAFVDTFLNEYGYLLDYVDGNMMDWMYSPKNLRKQMEEEGHIYYIAVSYTHLSPVNASICSILQAEL